MKSIGKINKARRSELIAEYNSKIADINRAKDKITGCVDAYNDEVVALNEIIQTINGFAEDVAREIDEYIDARSEKWQEGDAGSAYADWKSAWECIELDEVYPLEPVEDLDTPDISEFDDAPEEPEL